MKHTASKFAFLTMVMVATPAFASSDYLLTLPPAQDGTAAAPAAVDSWSFGVCNTGQCSGSGSTKRGGAPVAGKVNAGLNAPGSVVAQGAALADLDGDGSPDFAYAGSQDEVYGLSFTLPSSPALEAVCKAGKLDGATLSNGSETFAVSGVSILCGKGGSGAAAASYARSGINQINSMPSRLSTNLTVGKQTQGATFGEKVNSGLHAAGSVTITLTGGQMKYTKTGHVTLLK